jgi:hypothetical protein
MHLAKRVDPGKLWRRSPRSSDAEPAVVSCKSSSLGSCPVADFRLVTVAFIRSWIVTEPKDRCHLSRDQSSRAKSRGCDTVLTQFSSQLQRPYIEERRAVLQKRSRPVAGCGIGSALK